MSNIYRVVLSVWASSAAIMLLVGTGSPSANADAPEQASYPRITSNSIPLLAEAPAIDGTLELREWTSAQKLPPLVHVRDGQLDPEGAVFYAGYTTEALYIAWRIHRAPEAGPMKTVASEPGAHEGRAVWLDDAVEVLLDLDGDGRAAASFAGNAVGAFSDGLLQGTTDFSHSWDWNYSARKTDFGWEGELSIKFADLGLDGAPEPGTAWGFDVVRNSKTPNQKVTFLSYRDQWSDITKYSRLVFGGNVPAVRTLQFGSVGDESVGVLAESINASEQPAEISVDYAIFRRRPEVSAFNFFQQVDAGVSDPETQDVMTMATAEQQVAETLSLYEPVKEERLVRTVPPGQRIALNLTADDAPVGDYMIGYRFEQADGTVLAAGLRPAVRHAPLQVDLVPYYLVADLLSAQVTVHASDISNALDAVEFRLLQDDEIVLDRRVQSDEAQGGVALSTAEIVPGPYRLEVSAADATGAVISEVTQDLYRPEPPSWTVERHGTANFVPEPWEPVQAEQDRVDVWGREYHFKGGFLPAEVISQGDSILAAEPRMTLRIDGESVAWEGSLRLVEENVEYVDYEWSGRAGSIAVRARTRVEFDGLITVDLEMDTDGATIDEFLVEFPLRPEEVEVYSIEAPRGGTPLASGLAEAGTLDAAFHTNFQPAVWLGNTQRGLQWLAETNEFWRNEDKAQAIEVVPGADETVLRLRVVDRPFVTPSKISYRWGLMASPVKAYDRPAIQEVYYAQFGIRPEFYEGEEEAVETLENQLAMAQDMGTNWVNTFQWLNRYEEPIGPDTFGEPYLEDPQHIESHRKAVQLIHEYGMKTTAYTGWNGMHPNMSWWPYYGEAMKKTPTRFSFGSYKPCMRGGYVEYQANGVAWMVNELNVEGIYLDGTAGLKPCLDRHHGCGYVDPDTGRRVVTYNIWAHRELFKRMYKILHGEVIDDGLVYSHAGGPPLLAIDSFTDIRHGAEGDSLEEYLDLDGFRAKYYGRMYGLPLELTWVYNAPHNLVWGVGLLHDTPIKMYYHLFTNSRSRSDNYDNAHIAWRMWAPRQWFDWNDGYQWHPYYSNENVLEINDENVHASFHLNDEGQMIFIALNTGQDKKKAEFVLDLDGLKLPQKLYARDAVTDEAFEIRDGRFTMEILGHRPRVLMIASSSVPAIDLGLDRSE